MSSVLCIFSILGSSSAAISIACHEQRVAQSRVATRALLGVECN